MRKRIAAIAIGAALIALPASAQGAQREPNTHQLTPYQKRYLNVRDDYVKEFSLKEAGRDIVSSGYLEQDGDVHEATKGEVNRSIDRMTAALHPATPATSTTTATTTSYTGSSASSSTVACESGGDYGAVNPAGYYGAYQFDQGTWDAYAPSGYQGTNPASAPPSVQDAAAASVPYDAWPNC